MEKLLTLQEAAEKLQISRATIYRHMKNNILKTVKIGGARRVRQTDLEDLISKSYEKK